MTFRCRSSLVHRGPMFAIAAAMVLCHASCIGDDRDGSRSSVPKDALISAIAALPLDSLCGSGNCDTVIVDPVVLRIPQGGSRKDAAPSGRHLEADDLQFMAKSEQTLVMSEFTAAALAPSTMGVMVTVVHRPDSDLMSVVIDMYWADTFGTEALVEVVHTEDGWQVQSVRLWEA